MAGWLPLVTYLQAWQPVTKPIVSGAAPRMPISKAGRGSLDPASFVQPAGRPMETTPGTPRSPRTCSGSTRFDRCRSAIAPPRSPSSSVLRSPRPIRPSCASGCARSASRPSSSAPATAPSSTGSRAATATIARSSTRLFSRIAPADRPAADRFLRGSGRRGRATSVPCRRRARVARRRRVRDPGPAEGGDRPRRARGRGGLLPRRSLPRRAALRRERAPGDADRRRRAVGGVGGGAAARAPPRRSRRVHRGRRRRRPHRAQGRPAPSGRRRRTAGAAQPHARARARGGPRTSPPRPGRSTSFPRGSSARTWWSPRSRPRRRSLTPERLALARRARAERPLTLVDLSLPRAIDPACATVAAVSLHDLSGLEQIVTANRERREHEIPRVEAVLGARAARLRRRLPRVRARPLLAELETSRRAHPARGALGRSRRRHRRRHARSHHAPAGRPPAPRARASALRQGGTLDPHHAHVVRSLFGLASGSRAPPGPGRRTVSRIVGTRIGTRASALARWRDRWRSSACGARSIPASRSR